MYPFASPMMGQVAAKAGTTWDPTFLQPGATLSADRLSITGPSPDSDATTRSTTSRNAGKLYLEHKLVAGTIALVGAVNSVALKTDALGFGGTTSIAYYAIDGAVYYNNANQGSVAKSVAGDVIGIAVDLAARRIWFLKNGVVLSGDPVAGSGGYGLPPGADIFAAADVGQSTTTIRTNFGASAFAYAPPSGFSPWG